MQTKSADIPDKRNGLADGSYLTLSNNMALIYT